MTEKYVHIAILGLLVYSVAGTVVYAQPPQAGAADPFGEGDPFEMINSAQNAAPGYGNASPKAGRKPNAQAAVYFKEFYTGVNDDARVNPGNRIQGLQDNTGVLETRMTLSDHLDDKQTWRWLFRGYASTSSDREVDGALRQQARIDELFADWKDQGLFASLGKRRVNWGHAQGFNPVNVVAPPRDPLNPGYETEGQPMAWFSHTRSATTDVLITRNYDKNWSSDRNRWGLRWGMPAAESDYALYYFDGADYRDGRAYERMLGASFSANVMPGLTLYMELAGFSENYRNYYDTGATVQRKAGSYVQGVIGSLIDLGAKSSVFIEYYRNGQGYTEDERRNYLAAADARLAVGNDQALTNDFIALSMNQNYLLVGYKKEYRENYTFNLSVLVAQDGSSSTRVEGAYALSDYYEFRTSYLHNAGDRESEFGNSPYAGLLEIGFNASF